MSRRLAPPAHTATQSLGFPTCCDLALEQVARIVASTSTLPVQNRARAPNNELQSLLDRDLFCFNERKVCRLTEIQKFVLLKKLAVFFAQEEEKPYKDETHKMNYRYGLFETIFLGREGESILHAARIQTLFNLASFSLQWPSLSIFIPLAQWLRKMIGRTSHPEELIGLILQHFIYPSDDMKKYEFLLYLMDVAPEFGFIFACLAPNDENMGNELTYGMVSVITACLSSHPDEFLEMMADYPDKLAAPFASKTFPLLMRLAFMHTDVKRRSDKKERKEKSVDLNDENDMEEGEKADNDDDEEEEVDDAEMLMVSPTILFQALLSIAQGWAVRGVDLSPVTQSQLAAAGFKDSRKINHWCIMMGAVRGAKKSATGPAKKAEEEPMEE